MFEILPMDWNLKQIFTQKWASVDMNWGLNPPTPRKFQPCAWVYTSVISSMIETTIARDLLHRGQQRSLLPIARWCRRQTDRQTDRQSGKATQNFIEIGWQFTEIWQHNGYQDGKGPQRCILKVWNIFIFDRRPLLLRIFASLYKMSRKWKNPPYRIMA